MNGWQTTNLGALCSKVTSGGTPLRSVREYYEGGTIPWLKTGEVKKCYVWDADEHITERGLRESSAKLIPANSLIVAMYGDGNTAGNVAINKVPLATNQACCNFILNPAIADYRFVYHYLKGSYTNLVGLKVGGSQQNLNAATLKGFPISLPPLATQQKIAAILSAYDDLIANNQRRITLLERMAEDIYREWFVRLRFPGHNQTKTEKGLPQGWTVKKLTEICDITYGFPFQADRFNTTGNGHPIIRIRNIPNAHTSDFTDEVADTKYIMRAGDLLIGMDGDFHMNHWLGENAYLVQRSCRVKAKNSLLDGYISHAIAAPINYFQKTIVGATVGHLGAKHLNSIEILVPSDNQSPQLELLNSLLKQRLHLGAAIGAAQSTRDALLPRLVSGKLSVDELDIRFPPSMASPQEIQ